MIWDYKILKPIMFYSEGVAVPCIGRDRVFGIKPLEGGSVQTVF